MSTLTSPPPASPAPAPETVDARPGIPADLAVDAWSQPAGIRSRRVSWHDPMATVTAAAHLDGRAVMEAIAASELPPPPIAVLLGFVPTHVGDGEVVMSSRPGEHATNPLGTVHGGVLATLLDSAMGSAIQTTLPVGTAYATSDLQVRFVRPVLAGGATLHASGTVVHRGRRLATAEGRITDDDGRLYAHASTSCQLFEFGGA